MTCGSINQQVPAKLANGEGTWACGACGIRSSSQARFCWNCGAEGNGHVNIFDAPLKVIPGEPVYICSEDLNMCHVHGDEVSYVQVDTMKAKAPVPKTVTSQKLTLHNLIPGSRLMGIMEHDGAFVDVSDGASTTVSDNDNSSRSQESVDTSPMQQEVTTLMVCPLPYEVSSEELLQAVHVLGFSGAYDFVYMPSRSTRKGAKSRKGNVGYAFVNFVTPARAAEFTAAFEGFSFPDVDDDRLISVKPAACQGYTANFAMYLANKKKKQGDFMTFPMTEKL
jgi:hypothetical protein